MLVLHLCKVSCLCRCIVQRLGSADISVLAYNFWQATKASLLLGRQSPYFPPARMPGVYAKRLYARTHTSGRTKSVQDAPTTNDHDCTDAEPTKHTQPFTKGKGLGIRQGCRDRTPKGFARTQSQQSVLKGIENSHYLIKNRLFLQPDRRLCLRFLFVYIALNRPLKQTNFATYG